jgi:hypothetical protein
MHRINEGICLKASIFSLFFTAVFDFIHFSAVNEAFFKNPKINESRLPREL